MCTTPPYTPVGYQQPSDREAEAADSGLGTLALCATLPGTVVEMPECTHIDPAANPHPSSEGCEDCLASGGRWLHLRLCMECGHVGCCDSSPNRHATAHWHAHPDHPVVRSYEPGEDWWWCYADELAFEIDGAPPAPSHP